MYYYFDFLYYIFNLRNVSRETLLFLLFFNNNYKRIIILEYTFNYNFEINYMFHVKHIR